MDKEGTPRGGYYHGGDNSDDNDTNQGYSQDNFGEKEAMQPEFLNNEESNDANKEYTGDYRKENPLKKAENNAAKKIDNNDVKNGEKDPEKPSGFTNSVIGKNATGKGKGKGRFGKAKKTLPALVLALVFTVIGVFLTGNQVTMPFSLLAQLQENYDSIKDSNEMRSKTFWAKQMEGGELKDPIHKRYFGLGGTKFKISNNQRTKLASQGIFAVDDFGGTGRTALLFDDGSGKLRVVAANDSDVELFKGLNAGELNLKEMGLAELDTKLDLDNLEIDLENVNPFKAMFNSVNDFRNGYISGSRTWRGSVGAWFDDITVKFLQSNDITRNRFKDFQERVAAEKAGNTRSAEMEAEKKILSEGLENKTDAEITTGGRTKLNEDEDGNIEVDENNKPKTSTTSKEKVDIKSKMEANSVLNKFRSLVNDEFKTESGIVSGITNGVCGIFDVIGIINLMIMAQETSELIQIASGTLEVADKVKAQEGNDAPIHAMSLALVEPKASTAYNSQGQEYVIEGKESTSAVQSEGANALYERRPINSNDESVKNFTIGDRITNIVGSFTNSLMSFSACTFAKMAASVADIFVDLFTAGTDKLVGLVTGAGISFGISEGASVFVDQLGPWFVSVFSRNLARILGGENFGNAIIAGAAIYMGYNHLKGGGSLATASAYTAYAAKHEEVVLAQAKYDRETMSPFDITSNHTFLGSIMYQMAGIYTSKSSMAGILGTMGRMTSNAMIAMLPSASAYNIATTLPDPDQYDRNCPWLSSIGAVGDGFCNPYMITDMSTIAMDPEDVVDTVQGVGVATAVAKAKREGVTLADEVAGGNLDANGDIVDGSDLSKYIRYCNERSSAFGIADANIKNDVSSFGQVTTGNSTVDNVANAAIGVIPVVGSVIDFIDNEEAARNADWISGSACVATSGSGDVASAGDVVALGLGEQSGKWAANKYYQRYVEDQRYLKSVDPDYESPVDKYLAKYYEENPLDESYEGKLARRAGLPKETVVAMLDTMEYYDYIAKYDAGERFDFTHSDKREGEMIMIEDGKQNGMETVIAKLAPTVVYADVRNRSYAV